jgi:monoamine oxidase
LPCRARLYDWAIDLLDVAYNIEYGLETKDQSSLNMVDFITTDLSKPFSMFGVSDEVFRIKGGSSALITALVNALQNKIEMKQGFALTELDQKDKQIVMSFDAPGGAQSEIVGDDAGFAGLRAARLPESLEAEIGVEGAGRRRGKARVGAPPHARRGAVHDLGIYPIAQLSNAFQLLGSKLQALQALHLPQLGERQSEDHGIEALGAKPGLTDAKSALDAFRADLPKMSPKMAESLDPVAVMAWFWSVYPFTLGSYASAKVGQYTTMLEVASEPALGGRLQFAGEHTSSDFLGFMNGGVQSGNRAAAALIKTMALHK